MSATEKVNILMVDDQPGKLLSYEAMLNELGENLIKANSGREALEHLLHNEITVVLMDVSMPDLDGFELAEIIRGHPRFQKTAIIFVSAVHLSDVDKMKGYASGAVDYVSVPVVPELLRAKVGVFIELYRKTRESERLTRELEQRVAERTADLEASTAKQIELTKRLIETDRRKDEFLALLGHELRNPLAAVRNAVGVIGLKHLEDPDLLWCCDVIERQSNHLTRLVDDLLDISRISQGKIKLRREDVDLTSVMNAAVETSKPVIDARQHELVVTYPDRPVQIQGDPARLTQVIANLLNNAAKYQADRGHIALTAERTADGVEIRVLDRGIGIAPEHIAEVFDLFVQADRAPDRAQEGLGIGLSLVKTLVGMHGGSVAVASDGSGRGSEFIVRLPTAESAPASAESAEPAPAIPNAPPPRLILVVDDNRDVAETLAMVLRLAGNQVLVAYDGSTALKIAVAERPAVVLLDIGLPGIDGYEVCRSARAQGLVDAQIIAMTGFGQERDRQRAMEAGFDLHTAKPVRVPELMELLSRPHRAASEALKATG